MFSGMSNHSIDSKGRIVETYTCFYCGNTTDGLNKLASALIESEDDIVLTTRMEHHANDLSWRERCKVVYAEVDAQGRVIIPQTLREFAGLESDALVIGMNNRIEIWSKSRFDEYIASKQDTIAEALALLTF